MLHVVDISDPDYRFKVSQVDILLDELGISKIPQIRINNKSDIKNYDDYESRSDIESRQVWISAEKNKGLDQLRESISNTLFEGIYRGWISLDAKLGNINFVRKLLTDYNTMFENDNENNIESVELKRFTDMEGFNLIDEDDPFIQ